MIATDAANSATPLTNIISSVNLRWIDSLPGIGMAEWFLYALSLTVRCKA